MRSHLFWINLKFLYLQPIKLNVQIVEKIIWSEFDSKASNGFARFIRGDIHRTSDGRVFDDCSRFLIKTILIPEMINSFM